MTDDFKVPALSKAMMILNFISEKKRCFARDLLKDTNISRSSFYTLITDMINHGLIKQNEDGSYSLWTKLIELGNRAQESLDIKELMGPYLKVLMEQTRSLSVYFGAMDNNTAHYLIKLSNPDMQIKTKSIAGGVIDFVHSGIGKCLLANLSDKQIKMIIPHLDFTKITENSITSADKLLEDLKQIRTRGWSFNNSEDDDCIRSIAFPVFHKDKTLFGAVSAVGTIVQFSDTNLEKIVTSIKECAKNIEDELVD